MPRWRDDSICFFSSSFYRLFQKCHERLPREVWGKGWRQTKKHWMLVAIWDLCHELNVFQPQLRKKQLICSTSQVYVYRVWRNAERRWKFMPPWVPSSFLCSLICSRKFLHYAITQFLCFQGDNFINSQRQVELLNIAAIWRLSTCFSKITFEVLWDEKILLFAVSQYLYTFANTRTVPSTFLYTTF